MERYSNLVGKRVEAHYRVGDIELSVAGKLASDSGKALFIEERNSQDGRQRTMRMEIPYEFIVRVLEQFEPAQTNSAASTERAGPVEKKRY